MNYAIMLSGGVGKRLGGDIPKQYIKVKGHMVITYALLSMLESEYVDYIQIVADSSWTEDILNDVKANGCATSRITGFSEPGENRQLSIYNGMTSILKKNGVEGKMAPGDTVFVHDAARPFLTKKMIENCYKALKGHDGVLPVLPMKDTVYMSSDGTAISKLLDRSQVYRGQAPELFTFNKYYSANVALLPDEIRSINGSTEPAIKAGMDIAMIEGDENNFKITTKSDLQRCQEIINSESLGDE